jgi:hypothetical protein
MLHAFARTRDHTDSRCRLCQSAAAGSVALRLSRPGHRLSWIPTIFYTKCQPHLAVSNRTCLIQYGTDFWVAQTNTAPVGDDHLHPHKEWAFGFRNIIHRRSYRSFPKLRRAYEMPECAFRKLFPNHEKISDAFYERFTLGNNAM